MRAICIVAGIAMSAGAVSAQSFVDEFKSMNGSRWLAAEYRFKHPAFDTDWHRDRVEINNGLSISLVPQTGAENRYVGGSVRTHMKHSFGRYEAVMQPAKGAGLVTGFFTYTGRAYGDRHDEIDIEFLGKNTRQIHVALFVDGKLWNKFIDLDFDASEAPRRYAFEWASDSVRWFVDDTMIYERRASDGPLPKMPGHVFANLWAADPSIKAWSGLAKDGTHAIAKFQRISVQQLSGEAAASDS